MLHRRSSSAWMKTQKPRNLQKYSLRWLKNTFTHKYTYSFTDSFLVSLKVVSYSDCWNAKLKDNSVHRQQTEDVRHPHKTSTGAPSRACWRKSEQRAVEVAQHITGDRHSAIRDTYFINGVCRRHAASERTTATLLTDCSPCYCLMVSSIRPSAA